MSRLRFSPRAVTFGLLALGALLLGGCDSKGHWEEFEKVLGYRGKARLNPFLCAERMLDMLGHDARETKSLAKLPPHSAVLILSGEGTLSEGRARQLMSWAYSGGHLIYCLGGTRPYNDFESQFGTFLEAMLLEEQKDPVLERLGVEVGKRFETEVLEKAIKDVLLDGKTGTDNADERDVDTGKKKPKAQPKVLGEDGEYDEAWLESTHQVNWKGETYRLELGGYQQLSLARGLRSGEFSAGPQDEALALHLQHGMGHVTVLSHARPFRNRWIGEHDHARWLAALVGGQPSKEVLFVAAASASFSGMLWQHGWMALVALAVCLLFWLWRQLPRFGPLKDAELDSTRHFASHVGALGEFFWRMKRGALLVEAAREAVWARVHERHRSLDDGSRQMSAELAEFLAARSGLPAKRVTAAFTVAAPGGAHNFVLLMRDLQTIRRSL